MPAPVPTDRLLRSPHASRVVPLLSGLLGLLPLVAAHPLAAQNYERIAPQVPPPGRSGEASVQEEERKAGSETDADRSVELLRSLKGLVFAPKGSDVRAEGRPEVRGVKVEGVALLDEVEWQARLGHRFGQPFTMADLNEVMREVIQHYRESDRPVVDVAVIEQDITSGVVQLAVIEAMLGEVRVEGARHFKPEFLSGQIRLVPGEPIRSTLLMADLEWLNRNPFRSVDLVHTPGGEVGLSDVVLRVDDRFPLRVYAGYEDSGNELTGSNRWFAGFNHGNLWGIDHQLNYRWTFNNEIDKLDAHAASYVAPLPWRHILTVFGAYVESSADLPPPLDVDGHTGQLGVRYLIPLPRSEKLRKQGFRHEIELGYDFKNSTSNLEFFELPVLGQNTDLHQFLLGYRGSLRDTTGTTAFGASIYLGPGDWGGHNTDAAFDLSRAGATASYAYGRLEFERRQRLPGEFTGLLLATGQFSDGNLLPSEQLGFGGYSSVRGYEENEANLDEGAMLTMELRSPSIRLLPHLHLDGVADEMQLLAFWDYARGSNVDLLPGEARHTSMSSIGPGFRWSIGDRFSMRFDYGFQLRDSGQGLGLGDSRMHIGATMSY